MIDKEKIGKAIGKKILDIEFSESFDYDSIVCICLEGGSAIEIKVWFSAYGSGGSFSIKHREPEKSSS